MARHSLRVCFVGSAPHQVRPRAPSFPGLSPRSPGPAGFGPEKIDLGNKLMKVSASLARLARLRGIPGGIENPAFSRLWECRPMFELLRLSGAHHVTTDFCMWGEPWRKRTRLRVWHVSSSSLSRRCRGRSARDRTRGQGARRALLDGRCRTLPQAIVRCPGPRFVRRRRVPPPRTSLGHL